MALPLVRSHFRQPQLQERILSRFQLEPEQPLSLMAGRHSPLLPGTARLSVQPMAVPDSIPPAQPVCHISQAVPGVSIRTTLLLPTAAPMPVSPQAMAALFIPPPRRLQYSLPMPTPDSRSSPAVLALQAGLLLHKDRLSLPEQMEP